MTQATVVQPVSQAKTCLSCPHFNNFFESKYIEVDSQTISNPQYQKGWCELFNRQAWENHEETQDCINSSKSIFSHELQDNLALFPNVNFEELEAFPSEEIIDEADLPHAEYQVGSIVKIIDADEDYREWAIFEVIECLHNTNLHNSTETYLNQSQWYYRLCSYTDGNTMPSKNFALDKFLWVAENEICDFDMAHNVCTEDVF